MKEITVKTPKETVDAFSRLSKAISNAAKEFEKSVNVMAKIAPVKITK